MRRTVGVLFAAMLCGGTGVTAQSVFGGVKNGINHASQRVGSGASRDAIFGYVGGGSFALGLGEHVFVQPEILFSMKGFELTDADQTSRHNLSYLELPLLLKLSPVSLDRPLRPILYGGGSAAFEVRCDVDGNEEGPLPPGKCRDVGIDTPVADFGLTFGGGLEFQTGLLVLTVEGRYTVGLPNIDRGGAATATNRVFSILLGLSYQIVEPW